MTLKFKSIILICSVFIFCLWDNTIGHSEKVNEKVFLLGTSAFNLEWLDTIVSIEYRDNKGEDRSIGTGFLVYDGITTILVTCAHVILDEQNEVRGNLIF